MASSIGNRGLVARDWERFPNPQLPIPSPQNGFTLLELIVGLGITVVIVFILASVAQDTSRALDREQIRVALFDETQRAADTITATAESALAVLTNYTSTEPATYQSDSDTIIFNLPAESADGNLISGVVDTLVISRDPASPNQVFIRTFPGAGSARVGGTKRPIQQLSSLAIHYFVPDNNSDGQDEELTQTALYGTASRIETIIATSHPFRGENLTIQLVGGGRLRNAP